MRVHEIRPVPVVLRECAALAAAASCCCCLAVSQEPRGDGTHGLVARPFVQSLLKNVTAVHVDKKGRDYAVESSRRKGGEWTLGDREKSYGPGSIEGKRAYLQGLRAQRAVIESVDDNNVSSGASGKWRIRGNGLVPPVARTYSPGVIVETVKYTIWAADSRRAAAFYTSVFGGEISRQNPHITDVAIAGATISIHANGSGEKTWTGITFQVPDVVAGAAEIVAAGGSLSREPEPEDGEPPHLAMCMDTEGNQIMLTRRRS